jgi:hypothetical protein
MSRFHPVLTLVLALAPTLHASTSAAAWRQREFVLGGCYTGDAFDLQRFVLFQQAGLNLVINGDRNDIVDAQRTSFVLDSLRLARPGFDLKLIVSFRTGLDDARITFNPQARAHRAGLARTVGAGGGIVRPSVEGWMVWDEPLTDRDLQSAGELIALLDSLPATRDQLGFMSLLPTLASGQPAYDGIHGKDKREAYRHYLARVLAMYDQRRIQVPLICADQYPFETGDTRSDYFLTLSMLRDASLSRSTADHPVPFWIVVQLSPARIEGNRYRDTPTIPQIRWQVSTAIAYGAKGILYWTLVPSGPGEYGPGLVDRAGTPTPRYGPVRNFDLAVRRLGPVLMRLDPVAVSHEGGAPADAASDASQAPPSIVKRIRGGGGQGLVGFLRDRGTGENYLFVVNKGLEKTADFRIDLTQDCNGVLEITSADSAAVRIANAGHSFDARRLAPGTGALFRIEPAIKSAPAR